MGHGRPPGRARDWVSALSNPVMTAITLRGLGSGQVSAPTRPRACDSALTEPGRRLSARRAPHPALPLDPAGRAPPTPRAPAPGRPARNLPRAIAQPLALPASAAARRTQGTQRAPSNGRLATEPLPPSRRRGPRDRGRGHVTMGRGRNRHTCGAPGSPFCWGPKTLLQLPYSGHSVVAPWGRSFRPQDSSAAPKPGPCGGSSMTGCGIQGAS